MKTKCPKCKGIGSVVVDYKECDACGGTGYEDDAFDVGNHFKGVNSKARAKFDLGAEQDIPCEVCNGKGQVEVFEDCPHCGYYGNRKAQIIPLWKYNMIKWFRGGFKNA